MSAADRAAEVRALVGREADRVEDRPLVAGWLQKMCRAAARDLPASGVGVSLLSEAGDVMTAAASGARSVLVEELQFTFGEGPCIAAFGSGAPVLVPDLSATVSTTWPAYAPAAYEHGVRSVFAFPLQLGSARLGAMDVYRDDVGDLSSVALERALTFAEITMENLLEAGASDRTVAALLDGPPGVRFEVYQAQGMVMVQLGVTAEDALARMRAHAFLHGRRIVDVAQDVLSRRLVMERDDSADHTA